MIPSILSQQLKQGVTDFLRTTFPVSTPFFHGMIDRLLDGNGNIFKGPYLSIQLPFREGKQSTDSFPDVPMDNKPYLHQEQSFKRLSGTHPKSTLVATGTGSGKTEAFLYPILDHCYRHRGEPGIKAIIIYPMNALASDQAGRLARTIYNNQNLRGHITAGLFVGQSEKDPRMVMDQNGIITNKDTQRLKPPDILLTNYKMLDYLLIRAKDYPLWQNNTSETLKYLVVDELHTFDGAQGTDLACLLRRLKARLKTPENYLCGIGTSATLGTDEEKDSLLEYASNVFGETFDGDGVIRESRVSAGEFLEDSLISRVTLVPQSQYAELLPESYNSHDDFIISQNRLWFEEEISKNELESLEWHNELGIKLKGHLFFQNLLKVLGGRIRSYEEILADLEKVTPELKDADPKYKQAVLNSMLVLVSSARSSDGPFLHVRHQVWLRELRRMVGEVSMVPNIHFADDLKEEQLRRHLPIIHCMECGSMGWAGLKRQNDDTVNPDLQSFYIGFFSNDQKVVFLFPETDHQGEKGVGQISCLCTACLNLVPNEDEECCPSCGNEEIIRVFVPHTRVSRKNKQESLHNCPYCGGINSLMIMGSRAASLTSVLIAQLYSSQFNDDKKLLTFSDSVQDAAHRAGFFSGRTYHFNLRSAIQKYVQGGGSGLTLSEFADGFLRYWDSRMDENSYIATFLAPNMAWLRDYDYLKSYSALPKGSVLRNDVDKRLVWEIYIEFGFNARIGRTLEKTGSSVAYVDSIRFDSVMRQVLPSLQNEIGVLRDLNEVILRRFLLGMILHLKNLGGILHPELEKYIESGGNEYLINQKRIIWMQNFGPHTRAPVFMTSGKSKRFEQLTLGSQGRSSWYETWAYKCLSPFHTLVENYTLQIYDIILKALVKEKVLDERISKGGTVWGLLPDALRIGDSVVQLRCDRCSHNISVVGFEQESWQGGWCLRSHCDGQYEKQEGGKDYYGKLYSTGDVERIFAAEHTGLLKRDDREKLENDFKRKNRKPWDPNLLSCTPTLEMGIDIGDLSSVILCSVPPAESNYLQRIGRAGRRDGNALNFTVANARPHDLYFFSEPELMISGKVEPPGVFLKASAVLERQFTAFCFDRWVESGSGAGAIPPLLKQVLDSLEPVNLQKFPHNFLRYIENNRSVMFDGFVNLFSGDLSSDAIEHLKKFIEGDLEHKGSLSYRIMNGLYNQAKERESLRKRVRTLSGKIKKKQQAPHDKNYQEEIDELRREKSALQALVARINDMKTYNFFTDEGLTPNYAFPEAGVMLHSIVYRRKTEPKEGESNYDTWTYDYERPASSAISELAPANTFYAGGRKVEIDQVDMNVSEVEIWRFCDNCAHMVLIGKEEEKPNCPDCGSNMWSDAGQKRQMLRMRQVFATNSDRESRIGDDSDDREPRFYNTQMLADADDQYVTSAFRVDSDEMPFGFEFFSRITFREINFGEKGEAGDNVSIAGEELPRKGFVLCKNCGKIQIEKRGKHEIKHALTCTARNQESDKNLTECIYLYREFTSEAIRILLPVTTFSGSDQKLHSFVAALQLGLKLRFRGNIDHLQTTVCDEPVAGSVYRKKYLLLYDTVPGGTGYLKELMRSKEPLLEVFEKALEKLRVCACNQEAEKDGCYRCLYAYRRSYNMAETSRDSAVELLSDILQYRESLIETDNLKNVQVNALFDSELESRFIEALRRIRSDQIAITLSKELVNGKPGYFFKIGERAYNIELQVSLGEYDGINVPSKADFVFRPARAKDGGKPIIVFTDGYFYHKDRIGLDVSQRNAIIRSGKYIVWSLSWKDVENRYKSQGDYYKNYMPIESLPNGQGFNKLLNAYDLQNFLNYHKKDSFDWFVDLLLNGEEKKWQKYAFVQGLMHLDFNHYTAEEAVQRWSDKLTAIIPVEIASVLKDTGKPSHYGLFEPKDEGEDHPVKLFALAEQELIRQSDSKGLRLACILNNKKEVREKKEFESIWNGYLRLLNLFQFIPYGLFCTQEGMRGPAYEVPAIVGDSAEINSGWEEVRELIDSAFRELVDKFVEKGLPVPEVGYELTNDSGEVIAEVELAWPERKVAIVLPEQIDHGNVFEKNGWDVYPVKNIDFDLSLLGL